VMIASAVRLRMNRSIGGGGGGGGSGRPLRARE
jgi:hypothetical protein